MENKIKQLKLDLKGDKLSCHCFVANQFRNFITGLAYIIVNKIRKKLLSGTELGKAYCGRIILKLFKIGAVIIEKKTKIIYLLSSQYPFKDIFILAMHPSTTYKNKPFLCLVTFVIVCRGQNMMSD